MPHAMAWNWGTIMSARSCSLNWSPHDAITPSEWR